MRKKRFEMFQGCARSGHHSTAHTRRRFSERGKGRLVVTRLRGRRSEGKINSWLGARISRRLRGESAAVMDTVVFFNSIEPRVRAFRQLAQVLLQGKQLDEHLTLFMEQVIALL